MENNGKRSLALIPCYNEELTIGSIIIKAKKHVDEVLVIDDGSTDDTATIAKEAGAKLIKHKTNKGKTAVIKTGFNYALKNDFEYIVTLDGDAQHDPNEIPTLLRSIRENGNDIVLGMRFGEYTEMPLWRKFGKRLLDYTTSLGNGGFLTDSQCGFRAFNKKAIEKITPKINGNSFSIESEQIIRAHELGLKMENKPVTCKYKDLETSTKAPTSHGLSVLLNTTKLIVLKNPLILLGIPGLLSVLTGLLLGVLTLQLYSDTYILNLWLAITSSFLFIIGVAALLVALTVDVASTIIKQIFREKTV